MIYLLITLRYPLRKSNSFSGSTEPLPGPAKLRQTRNVAIVTNVYLPNTEIKHASCMRLSPYTPCESASMYCPTIAFCSAVGKRSRFPLLPAEHPFNGEVVILMDQHTCTSQVGQIGTSLGLAALHATFKEVEFPVDAGQKRFQEEELKPFYFTKVPDPVKM